MTPAWPAVAADEKPPEKAEKDKHDKDPATDKDKPAASSQADDRAQALQQGDAEPVSRVMGQRIVASAVKPFLHVTLAADWRWSPSPSRWSAFPTPPRGSTPTWPR